MVTNPMVFLRKKETKGGVNAQCPQIKKNSQTSCPVHRVLP
ncbi:MAG: hypothetical protein AABZ92_06300 [Verrucomicrobiota bacterium]